MRSHKIVYFFCLTGVNLVVYQSMQIYSSLREPAVADALCRGQVAVIPTDTVYGLVAHAQDRAAIARLYALKPRERQPGTIVAANTEQLHELGFSYRSLHIADKYWPDALSVVLDAQQVPNYLKTNLPDLAVRIPNHHDLLELLRVTGPLMTTSANLPSQPTATTVKEAWAYFGDDVDIYVDAGPITDPLPSTIIRIDDGTITVIRAGAVSM